MVKFSNAGHLISASIIYLSLALNVKQCNVLVFICNYKNQVILSIT